MQILGLIYVAIFGLIAGSFLNVCIYRIPLGMSIASPKRSFCPVCKNPIRSTDNIPLISYILLGGKCRDCKSKISFRYPLVELTNCLIYIGAFLKFGFGLRFFMGLIFGSLLLIISAIDFKHYIIPDRLVMAGFIVGAPIIIAIAIIEEDYMFFLNRLIGVVVGAGLIIAIALLGKLAFGKDAMGGGDIKLMGMIGFYLGWWPHLLLVLMSSALGGSFAGLVVMLFRKRSFGGVIPYGPFLSAGALVSMFYGQEIWSWYSQFVRF